MYGIDLKIEPGADDIDPIKLVISGQNDFGVASAESVLLANQKGANLVIVGVISYKSPTCFVALADKNINSVSDFENKRVGILTGTETETVYRILMKKNNINTESITEIEAPFDLASFIIADAYDIRPAFVYDELVTLDSKGIPHTIIRPEDYGVQLMGAVYFTSKKMISEKPEIVQAFVSSIAHGWQNTIKNPDQSILMLQEFDSGVDVERERASLKKGLDYFRGNNDLVLTVRDSAWTDIEEALTFLQKWDTSIKIEDCYSNKFINKFHEQSKNKN